MSEISLNSLAQRPTASDDKAEVQFAELGAAKLTSVVSGPVPAELQSDTLYSAALHFEAKNAEVAKALLAVFKALSVAAVVQASGMESL